MSMILVFLTLNIYLILVVHKLYIYMYISQTILCNFNQILPQYSAKLIHFICSTENLKRGKHNEKVWQVVQVL